MRPRRAGDRDRATTWRHTSACRVQTITLSPRRGALDRDRRWSTLRATHCRGLRARARTGHRGFPGSAAFPAAVEAGRPTIRSTYADLKSAAVRAHLTWRRPPDARARPAAAWSRCLIANGLGAKRTVIAIEDNKPEALEAMRARAWPIRHPRAAACPRATRWPRRSCARHHRDGARDPAAGKALRRRSASACLASAPRFAVCRAVRFGNRFVVARSPRGGGAPSGNPHAAWCRSARRPGAIPTTAAASSEPPPACWMGGPMMRL